MHEMRTAKRLVEEAVGLLEDGGDRVADVEVVLCSSARLSAESIRRHFELAALGTPVEGAAMRVRLVPCRFWCLDCMFEFTSLTPGGGACPRCGAPVLSLERERLAYVSAIGTRACGGLVSSAI